MALCAGEVAEWLKALLSKSSEVHRLREFESLPLRHLRLPGPVSVQLPLKYGEMSELAEGARLEIVCAVKSGTEGSNPSLSAIIEKQCLKCLKLENA